MAKKVYMLTEIQLRNAIKETIRNIMEGIDVDAYKNVTVTDRHEDLVDTSVTNNPTLLSDFVPGVKVWSIFQRKDDDVFDGNPLLYVAKGEKNYKLTNPQKFYRRLGAIIEKFFGDNGGIDVTIAIPSNSSLNSYFAKEVAKFCNNPQYIDNLFVKMSIEEVYDYVMDEDSAFRKHYGQFYPQKLEMLKKYMRNMGDTFRFHLVKDMDMRKVIERTIKLSDDVYGKYIDAINGKNILIIDDSLALGSTIKQACSIIRDAYTPKSISVLTLFSPLYAAGGGSLKNS